MNNSTIGMETINVQKITLQKKKSKKEKSPGKESLNSKANTYIHKIMDKTIEEN